MRKTLLTLTSALLIGAMSANGATFDVNFQISGSGYSNSTMTARTLTSIEFTGSYSFSPNSGCTEPFTIVRDGETVYSTLASDGKIATEEDDWGDETTAVYFNPTPFNQAGTYTITSPEGFFRTGSGNTSNAKEVVLTLTSPVPSDVTLVVDGTNVAMTAGADNQFTASGVEVTGAGSVKIQGSTYYGAVNGQTTTLTPGVATAIGYNGKNWTVANGTYDVTVDWNETAPTIKFAAKAPAVETFELGISVQGATAQNTAKEFQRIDLPAKWSVYYLNNSNTAPITVTWGEEELYSIDRTSSKLIPMDNDDDWEDDAYMINLGDRINRVGAYTITVPEGFFKSGSKVNAEVSKTVTVESPMPSMLSIRGKVNSGSLDADVEMKAEGSVFTASGVMVKDAGNGYGEIQLMGDSWYGSCNNMNAEVSIDEPTPVGYNGNFWKVPAGAYKVTVDWTNGDPYITFAKDTESIVAENIAVAINPVYYTLQGIRVNAPVKGETLIEVRNGKAVKVVY